MPKIKAENRIGSDKGNMFFERFFTIGFFVLIVGYYIFHDTRSLMTASVGFGLITGALLTLNNLKASKVKLPLGAFWYFLFFVYSEASSMWSIRPLFSAQYYLVVMILIILLSFFMSQYVFVVSDAENLLKVFIYSVLFISIIQLVFTPVDEITAGFLGSRIGGNNPNTFGYINMFSTIISFYFAYIKSDKKYYWLVAIFFVFSFLSSSRKAISMSLAGIMLIILFAIKRRHHLLHFAILGFAAVISLILIIEIDFLFDIVGNRFSTLINFIRFGPVEGGRGSLEMRSYFIEFAKILFHEKPIAGHGLACFSILLGTESNAGIAVYAHNNFWEILADLGILGFIIYYWFYAFLIIKSIIKIFQKNNSSTIHILVLTIVVTELILEFGVVSMTSFYPQVIMALAYLCSSASNSKRKFHYSPNQVKG